MGKKKRLQTSRPLTVHVVSHTHWDREWYQSAAIFRQRLVPLVDAVLALSSREPEFRFLLDGQAVILDDYLAVRPEQRNRLEKALGRNRIEAGPWYVLADELIPAGEPLVRNLLAGRRALEALGADSPDVLYCPDSFGHPATLPAIAREFGCDTVALWRGFGGSQHPDSNVARWRAPDGSEVLLSHLPRDGYEFGSTLPVDRSDAQSRWQRMREELTERDSTGVVLLLNGADHHYPQRNLIDAVELLAAVAAPDVVKVSTLSGFATDLRRRVLPKRIDTVAGELRDSYGYTWTLQGTFASRTHQKRSFASTARILVRETEPWSALHTLMGKGSLQHFVRAAWQPLLLCMPHDSLCGCSIDQVAVDVEARLWDAAAQASAVAERALAGLVRYEPELVRNAPYDSDRDRILIVNPSARRRSGLAEITVVQKLRDIRVGPDSRRQPDPLPAPARPRSLVFGSADNEQHIPVQRLATRARTDLIESPYHYPDADLVSEHTVLAWIPGVAGYSAEIARASTRRGGAGVVPPMRSLASTSGISNGIVGVDVDDTGAVWLTDEKQGASSVRRARVEFESVADHGDLYTASPRGEPAVVDKPFSWRVEERGPLRSSLRARFGIAPPAHQHKDAKPTRPRSIRRAGSAGVQLDVVLTVDAGSAFVRISCTGFNSASNHRLRLLISSDFKGASCFADAAFAVVQRNHRQPVKSQAWEGEALHESHPMHRYVSLLSRKTGQTVFSDGLAEYAASDTSIGITLLRCVGQLSRSDLPERAGNAGWPAETPLAQLHGPFAAGFAWMPHAGGTFDAVAADVEHAADDFLHPLRGFTLRSAPPTIQSAGGVELFGDGLSFSAFKPAESGKGAVLRCVNLTGHAVAGEWVLHHAITRAWYARMDEKRGKRIRVMDGSRLKFEAAPHATVTLIVE